MSWNENHYPGLDSSELPQDGERSDLMPRISELIEALLVEDFAAEEKLDELTIDQVTELLENAKETLEIGSGEEGDRTIALAESFERCKELFCSLLMTFEMHSFSPGYDETLADLRHRTQLTRIVKRGTPREETVVQETHEPDEMLLESDVPDEVSQSEFEPPSYGQPAIESQEFEHQEYAQPEFAKRELQLTETSLPHQGTEEKVENTWVGEPEAAWDLSEPADGSGSLEPERMRSQVKETKRTPHPQEALPVSAPLAKEYWQLSMFFNSLMGNHTFPLPEKHLIKLMGQSYCYSIEAECLEKLMPSLNAFWLSRESAIRALLDTEHRRFDLNAQLETGLREIADANPHWLLAGRLPRSSILNSLRYLLATHDLAKLKPALVDLGVMLLLFGQDGKIGGFPVHNLLRITGISAPELQEASFRLFRLHTLATRATGISTDFSLEHLNQVELDLGPILTLLSKIRFERWNDASDRPNAA
jgi:hypothetical protein